MDSENQRIATELQTALAEERLISETHLSDLETMRTQHLCLQQAHSKVRAEYDTIRSRLGHLQQSAREALGRGDTERGTLLEQIQLLKGSQLTPERVEMIRTEVAERLERGHQERMDRMAGDSDGMRQELSKLRYNYSFLKGEYEHEVSRRNALAEESERKHAIEVGRLKKEREQLLARLSSESEYDAKELRAVARENAQLKQKLSSLQGDLDTMREQGDERLVQAEELAHQVKSQLTEAMMQVSSLDAEKATLSLHVERTQAELSRTRTQLQEVVKEAGRVKEALGEAQNQLEESSHQHKLEVTEVKMQNEMRTAEKEEVHGSLTVKIRSLNDQLSDLNERLAAAERKNREQERITAEKVQSAREAEWGKLSELQEGRIVLETRVGELEALLSGRETEFCLQLEQSQDRVVSLQTELDGAGKGRDQMEEQMRELKLQISDLEKENAQHKTNHKKFSQLKNQFQSLAASELEYKQTNEQLNSRCLLLEEELKKCEYNHERIMSEFQAGNERNKEDVCEEMNRLNHTIHEISKERDNLRKKLDKVLRSAKKMKQRYKQKLSEYGESLKMCKAERDKIEESKTVQKQSLELEIERLCKKLSEQQRRQHEFNFLIHNQEPPQGRRVSDDVISVTADSNGSNAREIELLSRKLDSLTTRHSELLANLREHPTRPLGMDIESHSDASARD